MEYIPIRVSDIIRQINHDIYLPAIQREFVWDTHRIERLFDSMMSDFPIGSFLFWRLEQKNKNEWPVYQFVRDFDVTHPHNPVADMAQINKDIVLVLDGQQRMTSLCIGLKGSYRVFDFRWRTYRLYLNLLKPPVANDNDPEELTYEFAFREDDTPSPHEHTPQLWYLVADILEFADAEDAKGQMRPKLAQLAHTERENAYRLIGRLHNRIHTTLVGNYYLERSQDYDKVLQVFVRANASGQPLEYSDLLLATATARWETLDARKEIHDFTDALNQIGTGYQFGKDFVLKACLYLSETETAAHTGQLVGLPIQYKIKNFTKSNLCIIERNWESIKDALMLTVRLMARFGFQAKNIISPMALLPIAFFLKKRGNPHFEQSNRLEDVHSQVGIRRWFVFATLKNAFGGSTDTTLAKLRDLLAASDAQAPFPADSLYQALEIEPQLNDAEIERVLSYGYQGRYTYLVLALLYPDRDWQEAMYHEQHIFPQADFQVRPLKKRGYDDQRIRSFLTKYNGIANLQLLTETEQHHKQAQSFEPWVRALSRAYRDRHCFPEFPVESFDQFEAFYQARHEMMARLLKRK